MPGLWLERSARATVEGKGVSFSPTGGGAPLLDRRRRRPGSRRPWSTPARGRRPTSPRWAPGRRGAFVLIETDELLDLDGLFREYTEAGAHRAAGHRGGGSGAGLHVLASGQHPGPAQRLARLGQPAPDDDDGAGRGGPGAAACSRAGIPLDPHGRARHPVGTGVPDAQRHRRDPREHQTGRDRGDRCPPRLLGSRHRRARQRGERRRW